MRRLIATALVVAVATSSVALAATMDCPTMQARVLTRCCCPTSPHEHARLTCCNDFRGSRVITPTPRAQTERPQLAPSLITVADVQPCAGFQPLATALSHGLPASTAGPPPVPLRI